MAVFTLASITGAPGATTTALGLALAWPRDVVLVDADRTASQAVLAGYLHDVKTNGRGLTSLTQLWRDGIDLASDLPKHMIQLSDPDITAPERWFMPGFGRPGSSSLFEPVWPELMDALASLDLSNTDVIVDAGRWGSQGLPAAVIANTRWLGVVTRSTLRSLAALRLYLPDVTAAAGAVTSCTTGLVVIGPGAPYSAHEIADHFACPADEVPWQPDDASVLSDGVPGRPRADKRPLARSYTVIAQRLRQSVDDWDAQFERVGSRGVRTSPARSEPLSGQIATDAYDDGEVRVSAYV